MSRLQALQHFVAVVEAGSFTAAADRLGVAKSAVSRRVRELEQRLGAQLLNRTTRATDLTDSGRAFYERAVRVLADLDEAEAAVAQRGGRLIGTLRVALPLSFGTLHMAAPIAAFLEAHPEIDLQVDLNDRRVDLVSEGMDLALRIGHLRDSTLIARKLFDVKFVTCASPAYLAAHGTPATPEDLTDHHVLVYTNVTDPRLLPYVDAEGQSHDVRVEPRLAASNGDLLVAAAAEGQGIVVEPNFMAAQAVADGSLVPILHGYSRPTTPAYIVYPHTRHLSLRVRAFIDHVIAWYSGELPWDACCGV
ncbi:MAG: LysR family transcriptional regulator [Pseudomonadota bacterium]